METFNSKVYKTIKNMIIKQEIKYGEIISEDHLAKKLKVSRTPIREALNKLSQQGIIDNVPNRSKKVINFNEKYVHDLGITRLNCEVLSIRLAIHHGSNADFENLYPLAQKCIEYAESGDGSNWIKSEHNFHLSLIRLSKNDILIKILENLHLKVNLLMYSYIINFLNNKQNVKMVRLHLNLVDELKKRNVHNAVSLMSKHLCFYYDLKTSYLKEVLGIDLSPKN